MQVTKTTETEYIEEFTVVAGKKEIVFRSNRPELRKFEKRGRIKWQLVSKNFDIAEEDIAKASVYLLEIQDKIEDYIEPSLSFQQLRNKE